MTALDGPADHAQQLSLDDSAAPPARTTDPATSWAAARTLDPGRVGRQIARALAVVAARGDRGATCDEVVRATGGDRGCTARRLGDARARGLVRDSGEVRKSRAGRWQIVWVVTASGLSTAARAAADEARRSA